jgi:hypothetical protein
MVAAFAQDYAALDVPEVLQRLFHPRPELTLFNPPTAAREMLIPVTPDVAVGCVQGEDLFDIRKIVREKATAIIKDLKLKLPETSPLRGGCSRAG